MAKGDEPLRSFGDLLQFYKKATPEPVIKPKNVEPIAESVTFEPANTEPVAVDSPQPEKQADAPKPAESMGDGASPES